ncbi:hypothetical protein Scep_014947 [Stephania cephalantha]|uniref:SGNH hydrolase-type esterase domain-containing protein n=1 Tax=Stephania cephalantha TaxID=152367 RepID=A0AAP0P3H7_9MAGN
MILNYHFASHGKSAFSSMVAVERPRFVLFGSSIVQLSYINGGWGAILTHIYARKADILLRGYNGWNSRRALQVLHQVFPKDASVQPALVIVYFGGNDSAAPHPSGLGPHVPLQEYEENMRKIANHLKSLSKETRIIFLSCPPVNEERLRQSRIGVVRTNETSREYSEACIELAREMDLKVVDLWTAIQQKDNWKEACFTSDGIHFSAEGSKIVVNEILKILEKADEGKPSLHWKSMLTEFAENSPYYAVSPNGRDTLNPSEHVDISRYVSLFNPMRSRL